MEKPKKQRWPVHAKALVDSMDDIDADDVREFLMEPLHVEDERTELDRYREREAGN